MSKKLSPELSMHNKYWISRHRYYELLHFCMQYPEWQKSRKTFDGYGSGYDSNTRVQNGETVNPTEKIAIQRLYFTERINLVERIAKETDSLIADYILKGVTENITYPILRARYPIPCSSRTYYEAYRKFFWLLDKERR